MRRLRIGLLACGMVWSAAAAVGQTAKPAQDHGHVVAQELLGGIVLPTDSRYQTPGLTASQLRALQSKAAPIEIAGSTDVARRAAEAGLQAKKKMLLQGKAQGNEVCYAVRSYQMESAGPGSDTTSLKGYSSCQAASAFQAKNAAGPATVVPR